MKLTRRSASILIVALIAASGEPAFGQRRRPQTPSLPHPDLRSVYPPGVKAGGSAAVSLKGTDLEGASVLWFDHPGLRAEPVKGGSFRVTASDGVPVGHHDVRVIGTYGVSNPRTFVVGDRPETNEVEPNDTPAKATALTVNSVVNGEVAAATDVDCFAFFGKKGQRVLLDLEAERIESRLDATLRLLDASGREIGESRDAYGVDPFLDVTLPADGRYVAKLHDVTYRGQNDWAYRLTITDGPHIDAVVPNLVRAGESAVVTVYGRNLGGEPVSAPGFDGRPIEKKSVTLSAPATPTDGPAADYPGRGLVTSVAALRNGWDHVETSPRGSSNPVFVAVTADPVVVEHEPNDDPGHAQDVTLPCDISALFGSPGDVDVYRFKARKGETWILDAAAERIGSAADPVMSLQKIGAKGALQDVMSAEDTADRTGQNRFNMATVDASLRWTAGEDGTYQVSVNDLYGSQRGDVRLSYRLRIRPERPDFRLVVLPESQNQPDALTLGAGGRAVAFVVAIREDGFNGAIRVEPLELPAGVTCAPVVIPTGQSTTPVVFEAAPGARPGVGTVRLVGRARFGDRKDDLAYVSGVTPLGPDLAHPALPATVVWPGADNPQPQQQQQAPAPVTRMTRGLVLHVGNPAPLRLDVLPPRQTATPGSLLSLDLAVARGEGFSEAVAVTPVALLPNMGNTPPPAVTVAKGVTYGTYSFRLPLTLAPGVYTIVLQGAGPFPFSKDPKAKTRPNVTASEPSNPVTLVVRPAPVGVVVKGGTINLKAGASVTVELTVTRRDGGTDPVEVALTAPGPLKLKAEPVLAVPGKTAKLVVTAAADSPLGAAAGVAVRVTVPVRGEAVPVNEPFNLTIVK